jgi:hypothetical protein
MKRRSEFQLIPVRPPLTSARYISIVTAIVANENITLTTHLRDLDVANGRLSAWELEDIIHTAVSLCSRSNRDCSMLLTCVNCVALEESFLRSESLMFDTVIHKIRCHYAETGESLLKGDAFLRKLMSIGAVCRFSLYTLISICDINTRLFNSILQYDEFSISRNYSVLTVPGGYISTFLFGHHSIMFAKPMTIRDFHRYVYAGWEILRGFFVEKDIYVVEEVMQKDSLIIEGLVETNTGIFVTAINRIIADYVIFNERSTIHSITGDSVQIVLYKDLPLQRSQSYHVGSSVNGSLLN